MKGPAKYNPTIGWRERQKAKEEEQRMNELKKKVEKTEDNFPSLSKTNVINSAVYAGQNFAEKAKQWQELDTQRKLEEEDAKRMREREELDRRGIMIFNRKRNYDETPPGTYEYEPHSPKFGKEDADGWITSDRKVKKKVDQMTDVEYDQYMQRQVQEMTLGDDYQNESGEFNSHLVMERRQFY
jgi:hypothetical protein